MIGVVIAVRDQAEYLAEALDSLESQTPPPAQVIVVDDASVDGSGELARERGFRTELGEGKGSAIARNIGARLLETEYVRFLDGDDRFTPESNERLLAAIGESPAVAGMVREFFDPGREAELGARYKIADRLQSGTPGSILFRRDEFERLGGFCETEGEHELFGLLRALGKLPKIEDVVLERRIHGKNMSITQREEIHRSYLRSARAAIAVRRESETG
jgi:glycosyltransferase involved in cell wall biosynthesis